MSGIWQVLWLLILSSIGGSLSKGANAQVTDINSETEVLKLSKNVTKRELECSQGLYPGGEFCCQPCEKGEKKVSDCTVNAGKPTCKPCPEGKEYTDEKHYSPNCRRCKMCDGEHGFEVEQNCTRTQDTKCKCKADFYCENSLCEHCNPCIRCEHGIIEKCTATSNTKCQGSSSDLLWLWLLLIPLFAACVFCIYKWYRNKKKVLLAAERSNSEILLKHFTDVDLSKYITTIAEQMTITQVKEFVRKNGVDETKIDEIKNDHIHDTAEQKVQLLRNWYQIHGKKDACDTLIKGLKKAKLYLLAGRIHEIISKDIASEHENNANLKTENERQNLA